MGRCSRLQNFYCPLNYKAWQPLFRLTFWFAIASVGEKRGTSNNATLQWPNYSLRRAASVCTRLVYGSHCIIKFWGFTKIDLQLCGAISRTAYAYRRSIRIGFIALSGGDRPATYWLWHKHAKKLKTDVWAAVGLRSQALGKFFWVYLVLKGKRF